MILSAALLVVGFTMFEPSGDIVDRATGRFETTADEDSGVSLAGRGYDRIWNHKEHWIVGAGEGAYTRFKSDIGSHELHSSLGTLFFSYGIVGTSLFASFGFILLRGAGLRGVLQVIPAALYGLTHQGLRFTLLWVLLATVASAKIRDA
jgi:hypothetical protein